MIAHLEMALGFLARGDLDSARGELLLAWARAPQERLARLVELADARADATVLPASIGTISGRGAVKAAGTLATIAQTPHLAPILLEFLASPPWRAKTALPFWRACCDRIVATRDARFLPRLEEVALTYPKAIPTSVGELVSGYINRAVAALRTEIEALPPLDERELDACDAIEQRVGAKPSPKRTVGAELASELIDAIYAAPDDDAPRMVLADHLTQRDDPRGEFINLQLARAAGRADDETRAREVALLAASRGQWTGRIGMAYVPETAVYRRGFVAYAQVPRTKGMLRELGTDPAWHTLEILDVGWHSIVGPDRAVLQKLVEKARGLRGVSGLPARFLREVDATALARLERIEQVELAAKDARVLYDWLANAARPRCLGISPKPRRIGANWIVEFEPGELDPLIAAPGFARLETLMLYSDRPARWIEVFEATRLPRLVFAIGDLRMTLDREGGGFPRAVIRYQSARWREFPMTTLARIAASLPGRTLVIDQRAAFYPGMTLTAAVPTGDYSRIEGVVDDLTHLGR